MLAPNLEETAQLERKKCEMFTRHRAISQRRFPGAWAPMSLSLLWDVERPKPHTIGSSGGSHLGKW